ncbi:MAG: endonuclease/exonuclease/phosphatase family protein [Patescibacteria group bacterium]
MQRQQFKLITLNVGRGLSGIDRIITFLREQQADVLCLQDISADHIASFPGVFGPSMHFVPMCRHHFRGLGHVPVGVGIFSRFPLASTSAHAYVGNIQPVLDIDGVTYGENGAAAPTDLDLVRKTESRVAVFANVQLPDNVQVRVGTTHGVWTPGGKADEHQRKATRLLRNCMNEQLIDGGLIAGDFNAATGGEIYGIIAGSEHYQSVMPGSITNTVDWEVRGKKGPELVVDHVFAAHVAVPEVAAHFGVSDHAALSAIVRV